MMLLERHGLMEYAEDVLLYLREVDAVRRRYGPLLLAGAMHDVAPMEQPARLKEDSYNILSFVTLDSFGKSKLGIHCDTDQLEPCVCSYDSLYAPGFNDYSGGEFLAAAGVFALTRAV